MYAICYCKFLHGCHRCTNLAVFHSLVTRQYKQTNGNWPIEISNCVGECSCDGGSLRRCFDASRIDQNWCPIDTYENVQSQRPRLFLLVRSHNRLIVVVSECLALLYTKNTVSNLHVILFLLTFIQAYYFYQYTDWQVCSSTDMYGCRFPYAQHSPIIPVAVPILNKDPYLE